MTWTSEPTVCFTCDLDWAQDAVLADTLALFQARALPCTVFATHATPLLAGVAGTGLEVGLHPAFTELGSPAAAVLDSLRALYPSARGVRSHGLVNSSPLLGLFAERLLGYEANLLLPYSRDLRPFRLWNGLLRIPFNFEDDVHCLYARPFTECGLDLERGLNILNFHPIHVFLNTEQLGRYQEAKPWQADPQRLETCRNRTGTAGTRDLLERLLDQVARLGIRTLTLGEVLDAHGDGDRP